jgi:hypothetical protein
MWEPRLLTIVWVSTAGYRDTYIHTYIHTRFQDHTCDANVTATPEVSTTAILVAIGSSCQMVRGSNVTSKGRNAHMAVMLNIIYLYCKWVLPGGSGTVRQ